MEFSKEAKAEMIDPYVDIVEELRKGNGRPQMEIAEGVGLSEKYVALIERRERLPAFEVLLALLAEAGAPREVGENMMEELLDQFWPKNGTPV
jgi:transcriptional regulator with XRE-family HTH domain